MRSEHRVSIRELAEFAGVSPSTIHRIEQGKMEPTVEMLQTLVEALGMSMELSVKSDYAVAVIGLADAAREDIGRGNTTALVRKASELVSRFQKATIDDRRRMLAAKPGLVGDERWDAFMGALAEWLAVSSGMSPPTWVSESTRYLSRAWWVTPLAAMQAWEYAGTPATFQNHGVYIHRDSLVNA